MRRLRAVRARALALSAVVPILFLSACAGASTAEPSASSPAAAPVGASASGSGATCSYPAAAEPAKPATAPLGIQPETGTASVTISLTGGDVKIAMDRSKTPCTVGSFTSLARAGYFDGTTCHRLTTGSGLQVLQCGDPSGTGGGGPGYSFADETDPGMTYPAGTVAMANSGPNTNGSQFFLVYADSALPPSYTVFGKITDGLAVLTKIAGAGVSGGGADGPPASPVTISKVTVGS